MRPLQLAWLGVDVWAVVGVHTGCSLGPGPLRAEGWGLCAKDESGLLTPMLPGL